ncbi:MAG: hypothetical protein CO136_00900 [Candidatus Levybacteria bacterium CG_4_9_14_3_um_filter_36_7]|nr:MAG: hypothetical protein COW78_11105 [Bdellovibrio sp. CG22_combo_CG10-13_8_21_14_all_39_27]PIQ57920.1 MAG: hypothetical protein COW00_18280 [Bdellovibrio sp. CG12_big_fil_rev_8_21_14_0_65_39_13]PIR35753.1 MAG: hypothetical protein COV37_07045 [Bdellovibrio sp. CG11_big_fil_rev_8_21_14_0_20_39_38]PJA90738.1 MAG: hypothetical protein CO136_00900 [Candidatus Levybacteria bacterium CG_4_9_14_3_um_filter_36_7]
MNRYSSSQSLEIDLQIYTLTDLYIVSKNPDHEHFKFIISINHADLNADRIHFTSPASVIHFKLELNFMEALIPYKALNKIPSCFSYWEDFLFAQQSLTPQALDHELSNLYYRQLLIS